MSPNPNQTLNFLDSRYLTSSTKIYNFEENRENLISEFKLKQETFKDLNEILPTFSNILEEASPFTDTEFPP